ncbi:hypothetical protein LOTGIDRAFT_112669 [Lottia gigantea]|uniref:TsaA-like domain-containing protein n=1 Tax=Lottia gigantea TaxID=225164 RepID=V4AZN2_LOTGI|nr:hypothetical protein LOTGIDRAFT_112669 [Lottia gigantea]ESP00591.1 hypothetical protein LOTGIDRAFT_112669 [Lottia gigantea]
MKAIGFMRSVFQFKNGTPRQSFICPQARGSITIDKTVYNNPHHSLEGLQEYSHVWILFIFNQNNSTFNRAKVRPPRLGGEKLGIFATRSPYRFNPIGLTLAKLDEVKDDTLYVSGIDILDGTPIVDIKPYIPDYDNPNLHQPENILHQSGNDPQLEANVILNNPENAVEQTEVCQNILNPNTGEKTVASSQCENEQSSKDLMKEVLTYNVQTQTQSSEDIDPQTKCNCQCHSERDSLEAHEVVDCEEEVTPSILNNQTTIKTAKWLDSKRHDKLTVHFTENSLNQMNSFSKDASSEKFRLKYLVDSTELRNSIQIVLENDPRSIYRKQNPHGQLYAFTVDVVDITCWIDGNKVEVLRVRPISEFIQSKIK